MSAVDPDEQRAESLARWERQAPVWQSRADRIREMGMPISMWLIEQLGLQPGQRVLELAAGPGDTGFLAAELIQPGGTLVSSDAVEAMVEVARGRARGLGVVNVEFVRLELEWIDLPTASVDAIVCRWGLMLSVDPEAASRELRRVLRPGGRVAVAVWDDPTLNPWAMFPTSALIKLGQMEAPDPTAPGMFALADRGRLQALLEAAGFVDVTIDSVGISRAYPSIDEFLDETLDLSPMFAEVYRELPDGRQTDVRQEVARLAEPLTAADGTVTFPGSSLVAAASA